MGLNEEVKKRSKVAFSAIINRLPTINKPASLLSFTATGLIMIAGYKITESYFACSNPLYVQGVQYLHNNEIIRDVVGHPIKLKTLKNIFKTKQFMEEEDKIVLNVDFKGKKNTGVLTIYGRKNVSNDWEVKKVEVKLQKEYYFKNYILFRNESSEEAKIFEEVL